MKLNILNAKLRTMNAANAASEQPASVDTISVPEPVEKMRKLSAASLNQEAEDVQIEEAVQNLAKEVGVTIGTSKTSAPAQPIEPVRPIAPAKTEAKAEAKRPSALKRKPAPKAPAAKKASVKQPISTPASTDVPKVHHNELFIQDYSEKSFAVFGNTKPVKDYLKKCGGRFNPCLHPFGPDSTVPGWIFPMKARAEIEKIIC